MFKFFFSLTAIMATANSLGAFDLGSCCIGKFYHAGRQNYDIRVAYGVDSEVCPHLVSHFASQLKERDSNYIFQKYSWWDSCPSDSRYYPGFN